MAGQPIPPPPPPPPPAPPVEMTPEAKAVLARDVLDLILDITGEVWQVVGDALDEASASDDTVGRFNMAAVFTDMGIITIFTDAMALAGYETANEASLTLDMDGSLSVDAQSFQAVTSTGQIEQLATPTPAIIGIGAKAKTYSQGIDWVINTIDGAAKLIVDDVGLSEPDDEEYL